MPFNETFLQVECEYQIADLLYESFSFWVPGYRYSKHYNSWVTQADGRKVRKWDGKKHLFKRDRHLIYKGLLPRILAVLKEHNHTVKLNLSAGRVDLPYAELDSFLDNLKLKMPPREGQLRALVEGIRHSRKTFISATGTGKSFAIYLLSHWHLRENRRILIIVPTKMLVKQMQADFVAYGMPESHIQMIIGGEDKTPSKPIVISTWQSIYEQSPQYFNKFDVVFGDEVHQFKAAKLTGIMEKCSNIVYRYGFTGTLDGSELHQLVLEGLFGAVSKITTYAEGIKEKIIVPPKIVMVTIKYPRGISQAVIDGTYQTEIETIINNARRLEIVGKYVGGKDQNTLILVERVGNHLAPLRDYLKGVYKDRQIHEIYGGVDGDEREETRLELQRSTGNILLASYGTFQLGVNIPLINRILLASPSKSRVRVLQSIGRGLRNAEGKVDCEIFDFVDDFSIDGDENYTLRHANQRKSIYKKEGFTYGSINEQYFDRS